MITNTPKMNKVSKSNIGLQELVRPSSFFGDSSLPDADAFTAATSPAFEGPAISGYSATVTQDGILIGAVASVPRFVDPSGKDAVELSKTSQVHIFTVNTGNDKPEPRRVSVINDAQIDSQDCSENGMKVFVGKDITDPAYLYFIEGPDAGRRYLLSPANENGHAFMSPNDGSSSKLSKDDCFFAFIENSNSSRRGFVDSAISKLGMSLPHVRSGDQIISARSPSVAYLPPSDSDPGVIYVVCSAALNGKYQLFFYSFTAEANPSVYGWRQLTFDGDNRDPILSVDSQGDLIAHWTSNRCGKPFVMSGIIGPGSRRFVSRSLAEICSRSGNDDFDDLVFNISDPINTDQRDNDSESQFQRYLFNSGNVNESPANSVFTASGNPATDIFAMLCKLRFDEDRNFIGDFSQLSYESTFDVIPTSTSVNDSNWSSEEEAIEDFRSNFTSSDTFDGFEELTFSYNNINSPNLTPNLSSYHNGNTYTLESPSYIDGGMFTLFGSFNLPKISNIDIENPDAYLGEVQLQHAALVAIPEIFRIRAANTKNSVQHGSNYIPEIMQQWYTGKYSLCLVVEKNSELDGTPYHKIVRLPGKYDFGKSLNLRISFHYGRSRKDFLPFGSYQINNPESLKYSGTVIVHADNKLLGGESFLCNFHERDMTIDDVSSVTTLFFGSAIKSEFYHPAPSPDKKLRTSNIDLQLDYTSISIGPHSIRPNPSFMSLAPTDWGCGRMFVPSSVSEESWMSGAEESWQTDYLYRLNRGLLHSKFQMSQLRVSSSGASKNPSGALLDDIPYVAYQGVRNGRWQTCYLMSRQDQTGGFYPYSEEHSVLTSSDSIDPSLGINKKGDATLVWQQKNELSGYSIWGTTFSLPNRRKCLPDSLFGRSDSTVNDLFATNEAFPEPTNGVLATFYQKPEFKGISSSRVLGNIDFLYKDFQPADGIPSFDWSAIFSGKINIPTEGNWIFHLNVNDGANLYIDGTKVIDALYSSGLKSVSTETLNLSAGEHDFEIEYFQHVDEAVLQFLWEGPGVEKSVIPSTHLSTPEDYYDVYHPEYFMEYNEYTLYGAYGGSENFGEYDVLKSTDFARRNSVVFSYTHQGSDGLVSFKSYFIGRNSAYLGTKTHPQNWRVTKMIPSELLENSDAHAIATNMVVDDLTDDVDRIPFTYQPETQGVWVRNGETISVQVVPFEHQNLYGEPYRVFLEVDDGNGGVMLDRQASFFAESSISNGIVSGIYESLGNDVLFRVTFYSDESLSESILTSTSDDIVGWSIDGIQSQGRIYLPSRDFNITYSPIYRKRVDEVPKDITGFESSLLEDVDYWAVLEYEISGTWTTLFVQKVRKKSERKILESYSPPLKISDHKSNATSPSVSVTEEGLSYIFWKDFRASNPRLASATWELGNRLFSNSQGYPDRIFNKIGGEPISLPMNDQRPFVMWRYGQNLKWSVKSIGKTPEEEIVDSGGVIDASDPFVIFDYEDCLSASVDSSSLVSNIEIDGKLLPVVASCSIRFELQGPPHAYAFRVRSEGSEFSKWIHFDNSISNPDAIKDFADPQIIADQLYAVTWMVNGSGKRKIDFQLLGEAGASRTFSLDVFIDSNPMPYSMKFFSDSDLLNELPKWNGQPVASRSGITPKKGDLTSINSNQVERPSIYMGVYFDRPSDLQRELSGLKSLGFGDSLSFDLITRGKNRRNLPLEKMSDSGIYRGEIPIFNHDGLDNIDGPAGVVVNLPLSCLPDGFSLGPCGEDDRSVESMRINSKELFLKATRSDEAIKEPFSLSKMCSFSGSGCNFSGFPDDGRCFDLDIPPAEGPVQCAVSRWASPRAGEPYFFMDGSENMEEWVEYSPVIEIDFSDERIDYLKFIDTCVLDDMLFIIPANEEIVVSVMGMPPPMTPPGVPNSLTTTITIPSTSILMTATDGYYCHGPSGCNNGSSQKIVKVGGTTIGTIPAGSELNDGTGTADIIFSSLTQAQGTDDPNPRDTGTGSSVIRGTLDKGISYRELNDRGYLTPNETVRFKMALVRSGSGFVNIRGVTCGASCLE